MNLRRGAVLVTALTAITIPMSLAGGAGAAPDGGGDPRPALPEIRTLNGQARGEAHTFTGANGSSYTSAPDAVPGRAGELFFGAEFDAACAYGRNFVRSLEPLTKLARVIERSGREAIWTLGVSKISAFPERIDETSLPHGRCAKIGIKAQAKTVRTYDDPRYLPLANKLARTRHQTYYKTDAHWSTVGGAVYAQALAKRLSMRLARHQRYRYGSEQWNGMLNSMRGVDAPETAETASPRTRVDVRTRKGVPEWPGWPALTSEHSWKTFPQKRTYPGKTLLVGDSFMMFALENLRPLFREGRWMWYAYADLDDVIDAIVESDTVVLEVYQTFTAGTGITEKLFLRKLRKALK